MSNANTNIRIPAPNTGTLFANARRPDKQDPQYVGLVNITQPGIYRVSTWVNTGKNGKPYLSQRYTLQPPVQEQLNFDQLQQPEDIEQLPAA